MFVHLELCLQREGTAGISPGRVLVCVWAWPLIRCLVKSAWMVSSRFV